jgi:hypothetical protein
MLKSEVSERECTTKFSLILCNEYYGNVPMPDLPFVKNDLLNTRATSEMMGVPDENIFELLNNNFD